MATRANSTLVPRRRQPLPTAGRVYTLEGEKPRSPLLASEVSSGHLADFPHLFPQKGENLLVLVRPTVGTSSAPAENLRHQLHDIIERALALLDALDGDPDLEPSADFELDDEDCCAAADDDPVPNPARQPHILYGAGDPEDGEAALQPVTLAPDWVRPVVLRRSAAKPAPAIRGVQPFSPAGENPPLHAFVWPGRSQPNRPPEMPVPPPANSPPGFDSDGEPIKPSRKPVPQKGERA